jgi:hypothetical protein
MRDGVRLSALQFEEYRSVRVRGRLRGDFSVTDLVTCIIANAVVAPSRQMTWNSLYISFIMYRTCTLGH